MSHRIEVRQLEPAADANSRPETEIEPAPPLDDTVVELARRYPLLSRALAEYLAR